MLWVFPLFFFSHDVPDDVLEITPLQIENAKQVLKKPRTTYQYDPGKFSSDGNTKKHIFDYPRDTVVKSYNKERTVFSIDINTADSIAFESLPGIGEKLSSRIVRYRERLGGFVSVGQLTEVYGLQDSVLKKILHRLKLDAAHGCKKIKLNQSTYAELRKHPYFGHVLAKSIVAFRAVHGPFKNKQDLLRIASIDEKEIDKILPYCSFDE